MSILVTGGCGYIGSHVVRQLSEAGQDVSVLDNLSTGYKKALIHNERLIQADLANTQDLEKIFRENSIDSVLHFAASIVVSESVKNPAKYYTNNSCNTLNLINTCVKYKVKNFIFSSTAAVYGLPASGIASETSTSTQPINPYGASKLISEIMLKDIALTNQMNYVILRYFNVAGADPSSRIGQRSPEATHLIKVCCQTATGLRNKVEIFGTDYQTPDGTCIRDYIHIEDLANAHIKSLSYLQAGGKSEIMNLGYGHGSSVREVIETVQKVTKINFPVQESPRREGDPPILIAEVSKALQILDWKPQFNDLEKIIRDAYNWEKVLNDLVST